MNRLKCSNRVPVERRDSAGNCFVKGRKVGFAAGIALGKKQQKDIQKRRIKTVEAITKVLANREFRTVPLNQATNDALKSLARQKGITNYRNKNRETIIRELRGKNIQNIKVPR